MLTKLRDRRVVAGLAVLGLGFLVGRCLRRRGGEAPDDVAEADDIDVEDIDPEDLSVDVDPDVETDIESLESDPDATVEPLESEPTVRTSDLVPAEDEALEGLVESVLDDVEVSPADVEKAVAAEFEGVELDEEVLAEVQEALDVDPLEPSPGGTADPDGGDDGDGATETGPALDPLDALAVVAAGLRGAFREYRRRTDDGGA